MLLSLALLILVPNPYVDRVLVVMNKESPVSMRIGADYMKQRQAKNRVFVTCPDSSLTAAGETVHYAAFRDGIAGPIGAYLSKHPSIDFIVLTKGIPIRIDDAPGMGLGNSRPSVDSVLAQTGYDKVPGALHCRLDEGSFKGSFWANRYWAATQRFSHAKFGGYLVTRLDGYTEEDARLLVRWAMQSEGKAPTGEILLDSKGKFKPEELAAQPVPIFGAKPDPRDPAKALADVQYKHFDMDLQHAGDLLKTRGLPVRLDTADAFVSGIDLMGYASWGSNDPHFNADRYHALRFAPGAIAETAVSTSGRTFLPTTGGQSLIADLIHQRVTGVKGYCDEPLLTAIASPTILFDRYTRGWTLAESFYAASRWIGWEDIVIGDPICQPYGRMKN